MKKYHFFLLFGVGFAAFLFAQEPFKQSGLYIVDSGKIIPYQEYRRFKPEQEDKFPMLKIPLHILFGLNVVSFGKTKSSSSASVASSSGDYISDIREKQRVAAEKIQDDFESAHPELNVNFLRFSSLPVKSQEAVLAKFESFKSKCDQIIARSDFNMNHQIDNDIGVRSDYAGLSTGINVLVHALDDIQQDLPDKARDELLKGSRMLINCYGSLAKRDKEEDKSMEIINAFLKAVSKVKR